MLLELQSAYKQSGIEGQRKTVLAFLENVWEWNPGLFEGIGKALGQVVVFDSQVREVRDTLLGFIAACILAVLGYFFGAKESFA